MKDFEYAAPRTEAEAVGLLSREQGQTELLAGGTDLVGLLQKGVVSPGRVINLLEVASMCGISSTSAGTRIGAVTRLEEMLDAPALDQYAAVKDAIRGIDSLQLQSQGTLGGELCQRPRCWYFRSGQGLLAENGRRVTEGVNRLHAILGNTGPAKFVSPSRLAPALIALGARVRIVGPATDEETYLPLEFFYRTPRHEGQREYVLEPGQIVSHVDVPAMQGRQSATYEVKHGAGPSDPLAAAAAVLSISGGVVQDAMIVLGQVAPTPWVSTEAARSIIGQRVTPETAAAAGVAAVAKATPLSENGYKVQLAQVAVKRAILRAAGLETGGL